MKLETPYTSPATHIHPNTLPLPTLQHRLLSTTTKNPISWGLCWEVDVCPPPFTLLQPEMPMDGVISGWCDQPHTLQHASDFVGNKHSPRLAHGHTRSHLALPPMPRHIHFHKHSCLYLPPPKLWRFTHNTYILPTKYLLQVIVTQITAHPQPTHILKVQSHTWVKGNGIANKIANQGALAIQIYHPSPHFLHNKNFWEGPIHNLDFQLSLYYKSIFPHHHHSLTNCPQEVD